MYRITVERDGRRLAQYTATNLRIFMINAERLVRRFWNYHNRPQVTVSGVSTNLHAQILGYLKDVNQELLSDRYVDLRLDFREIMRRPA